MESNKNVDYLLNSARAGDVADVRFYVESRNVDLNSTDGIGRTALHKAAYRGKNFVVVYLLARGTNFNSKVECNDPELSGATALAWAVMSGYVDVARTLIQHGANVDVVLNKISLLGIAVMSDSPSMIYLILGYIPDINECDFDGRTPLVIALVSMKVHGFCQSLRILPELNVYFFLISSTFYTKCPFNLK